jgi:hypothetical protein
MFVLSLRSLAKASSHIRNWGGRAFSQVQGAGVGGRHEQVAPPVG